jgi:hypothetical protein
MVHSSHITPLCPTLYAICTAGQPGALALALPGKQMPCTQKHAAAGGLSIAS